MPFHSTSISTTLVVNADIAEVADSTERLALTDIYKGYRCVQSDMTNVIWEYQGIDPSNTSNWRGYLNTNADGELINPVINQTYTQEPLSSDPPDPDAGNSVQWVSDGTDNGNAGDIMMKINVGDTVKIITLVDYLAQ